MNYKIAFVTCKGMPELSANDQLAVEALTRLGVAVEIAIWNEPRDWSLFDAIILRSTWDYWRHYSHFLHWLTRLEEANVRVWNSVGMVRWNSDKNYLRELATLGVPVVPTMWLDPGDWRAMKNFEFSSSDSDEVVLKPAVSGGATLTYRLKKSDFPAAKEKILEVWGVGTAMVQPFLKTISQEGEYSFLFFGGKLSHVVCKRPVAGDFRVQPDFGGMSVTVDVEPEWVALAQKVLRVLPFSEVPLYARVDMVRDGDSLQLMELELIEPNLFFADHSGSASFFAKTLCSYLISQS